MVMGIKQKLINTYDKKYKPLMFLSFAILMVAMAILGYSYYTTGEFVQKGVSLKGGITLTISVDQEPDMAALEANLKSSMPKADVSVRKLTEAGFFKHNKERKGSESRQRDYRDFHKVDYRLQIQERKCHIGGNKR